VTLLICRTITLVLTRRKANLMRIERLSCSWDATK
jgi:hypothetical protein